MKATQTEPVIITESPNRTGNPVKDFQSAIEKQGLPIYFNRPYHFGSIIVRFYLRAGKVGMDHYRPVKSAQGNLYSVTRITASLKRESMGFTTFSL